MQITRNKIRGLERRCTIVKYPITHIAYVPLMHDRTIVGCYSNIFLKDAIYQGYNHGSFLFPLVLVNVANIFSKEECEDT